MSPIHAGEIRTHDLYFAAYLRTSKLRLVGCERVPGDRRAHFVFEVPGACDVAALRKAWIDGTGMVPASDYAVAVRALKDVVHQVVG